MTGRQVPQGLAGVGWRIGVYWREDHKFYLGELASYNDEEDLYEMNYDDSKLLNCCLCCFNTCLQCRHIWEVISGISEFGSTL